MRREVNEVSGVRTQQPEAPAFLSGIDRTAFGSVVLRAEESGRPDRLFNDPYARLFVDAAGVDWSRWSNAPATGWGLLELLADQVAVRTRFLDEASLEATQSGCGQVVIVGAGMDTRAFRLNWPADTRVFDVDVADVLAFRSTALAKVRAVPRCHHVEVAADLNGDWATALYEAGFQPQLPTVWLAEGILYSLSASEADRFLRTLTGLSAPGSVLAADHIEDWDTLRAARAAISAELVTLWRGGPTGGPDSWLRGHGWQPTVREIDAVAVAYGRPVPLAFDPTLHGSGRAWLFTARFPGRTP